MDAVRALQGAAAAAGVTSGGSRATPRQQRRLRLQRLTATDASDSDSGSDPERRQRRRLTADGTIDGGSGTSPGANAEGLRRASAVSARTVGARAPAGAAAAVGQDRDVAGSPRLSVGMADVRGGLSVAAAAAAASPNPSLLQSWRQRRKRVHPASGAGGDARTPVAAADAGAVGGAKAVQDDKAAAGGGQRTDPAAAAALATSRREWADKRGCVAAVAAQHRDAAGRAAEAEGWLPLTPSVSHPVPIVDVEDSDDRSPAAGGRRGAVGAAVTAAAPHGGAAAAAPPPPPAGAARLPLTGNAATPATVDMADATPTDLAAAVAVAAGRGLPPHAAARLAAALAHAAAEDEITGHVASTQPPDVVARRLLAHYPRAPSGALPFGTLSSVVLYLRGLQSEGGANHRVG